MTISYPRSLFICCVGPKRDQGLTLRPIFFLLKAKMKKEKVLHGGACALRDLFSLNSVGQPAPHAMPYKTRSIDYSRRMHGDVERSSCCFYFIYMAPNADGTDLRRKRPVVCKIQINLLTE